MPITYTLQGKTDRNIDSYSVFFTADNLQPVIVGEYQTHTVLKNGTEYVYLSDLANNVQYVSATTANWGQGIEQLTELENDQATIKIMATFEEVTPITEATVFVYEDSEATAPENMALYAVEAGKSTWQNVGGSDNALTLTVPGAAATTHTWYIALSATPGVVGTQSGIVLKTNIKYG